LRATSRDTVDTAQPNMVAMAVKVAPCRRATLMSSRSAKDSRLGPADQHGELVGRVGGFLSNNQSA
jgi:hypothetical protein